MKPKFKKCSECGRKMVVKKGGKGRFWACTGYKDGCSTTSEFHGYGPKAGIDLDIRQIVNGFIIKDFFKYAESVDDEEPSEMFCTNIGDLKTQLSDIVNERVSELLKRLEQAGDDFVEEDDDEPIRVSKQAKSKDINALLRRVKKTREDAAEEMAAEET